MPKSIAASIAKHARPKEREIRAAILARVKAYRGAVRPVAFLGRRGAPDILCLLPGRAPVWVETKMVGGRLSDAQEQEIGTLRMYGCEVKVIVLKSHLDAWLPPLCGADE